MFNPTPYHMLGFSTGKADVEMVGRMVEPDHQVRTNARRLLNNPRVQDLGAAIESYLSGYHDGVAFGRGTLDEYRSKGYRRAFGGEA